MDARSPKLAPTVVIADDFGVTLVGLRTLLEKEGFNIVGEARDGVATVELCSKLAPDLAIVDIGMPLRNGLEACRIVKHLNPSTKVLLYTMYGSDWIKSRLRAVNADAFLLKSDDIFAKLVPTLRLILAGEKLLPTVNRPDLTAREGQIVELLAAGQSTKEVAATLGIAFRTAETHRANIMTKLDLHSAAELTLWAVKNGYILTESVHELSSEGLSEAVPHLRNAKTSSPGR